MAHCFVRRDSELRCISGFLVETCVYNVVNIGTMHGVISGVLLCEEGMSKGVIYFNNFLTVHNNNFLTVRKSGHNSLGSSLNRIGLIRNNPHCQCDWDNKDVGHVLWQSSTSIR